MPNRTWDRSDDPSSGRGGAVSIDQLIALNDEILALVRAGLPLERGLRDAGKDLGGRLGSVTESLANRMAQGESLSQALAAESDRIPKLYRAVVEAGARAGRLSVALEGLSAYARGYVEMRQAIGLALFYPVLIVMLAYGLFIGLSVYIAPRFLSIFQSLGLSDLGFLHFLSRAGASVTIWGPILPALLPVGLLAWWLSGRAVSLDGGWGRRLINWTPWVRGILSNAQAASFSDVLALLVEHGAPLHEAIPLAADATGDAALRKAAAQLAEAISRGDSPRDGLADSRAFPAMLRWLLATSEHQTSMVSALKHAAATYRRRALHQAELLRVFVPRILLLGVGGSAALIYVLALIAPLAAILTHLAHE
jgi:type II secretory pathway component PulF